MRTSFIRALTAAAEADPRVTLVVGDLGFSVVEEFAARFPRQFLNAGVAEQNMSGVAAGLALAGRIVFTYSIGNFPTLRCLEQIRNDICYHGLPVCIVAVGGGFAYGSLAVSHHATEDLAVMRSLPRMTVIAPGDPLEAGLAVPAIIDLAAPCYLRLGKTGEPPAYASPPPFQIGRAIVVRNGADLTLISTGGMLETVMEVAAALERERHVGARVLSMHTLSPLDVAAVRRAAVETAAIVTVEEHSVTGGLGSAVAEVLAEQRAERPPIFGRVGITTGFSAVVGDQRYLRDRHGLSVDGVRRQVEALVAPLVGQAR